MSSNGSRSAGMIWGLSILAGVLAFFGLTLLASYTFWPALLLAILIAVLVAILLWIGFYRDEGEAAIPEAEPSAAPAPAASAAATEVKSELAPPPTKASEEPEEPEPEKAAKPAAAKKPAAKKPAAEKTAARKTTARKPVAKDGKPEMLSAPRDGQPDDLKMIKGVGPKLEKLLNSMGIYHFDQIASWRAKEVKWVDENLKGFKGRVSRDEWVKQAKVLAKGGTTEFSKRVKKGDVY